MNLFQKYIAYLKDNPKRYWFKRKVWGWGWTPATWEGWLTVFVFAAVIVLDAFRLEALEQEGAIILGDAIIQILVLAVALIVVCFWKGEPPKWQWGFPKKSSEEHTILEE